LSNNTDTLKRSDFLLYDGECPVCSRYVLWTNIRNMHPDIALLDARQQPELVTALRTESIEINNTMLLQVDGRSFVGAAAMAKISSYMPQNTLRQRVLRRLTNSQLLLQPIYHGLVLGRKLLLALLRRRQIR
jgi:predicted DCC family thiol-disulfide oxidoreductase YuxK